MLEPHLELVGSGGELLDVDLDHRSREHPGGLHAGHPGREPRGGRGRRCARCQRQPEVDLPRLEPPLRLHLDIGLAGQRRHMLRAVGPQTEPLLPAGGEGRHVGRARPQPPRADGHQGPRITRRAGGVVDRPRLHLRLLEDERHRLLAIEDDPPRGDLIAQAHRPGFEPGGGAPGHDRRPLGLDLHRLQSGRHRSRLLVPPQNDGEELTGKLIMGAARERADDIDMILERDHVRRHVHAQASPATDEHRRRLLGAIGGSGCRCRVSGR